MTDKELLELAAKAAGINPRVVGAKPGLYWLDDENRTAYQWNPITDDGDALRLAVKLSLDINCYPMSSQTSACLWKPVGVVNFRCTERTNDDPYAATRRAIVRAAAEIGKERK